ncbi:MAG: hypothetical protein Q4G69_04260 [Planctomycetia bacterium]|nr:hypothetical protein [Planctomycetia bacterium]
MGFLKQFFRTIMQEGSVPKAASSFERIGKADLQDHLAISRYGSFELTDAIRPSYDCRILPKEGVRRDTYCDPQTGTRIPVLMGAASREKLFDLFIDLLDPLGSVVDVVLETSHRQICGKHDDLLREAIDLPVLKSVFCNYEDLLMNDGCTGIAVLNSSIPYEVQFDEHKLLIVYGSNLEESEQIFAKYGVKLNDDLHFLTEAEHVHSSRNSYQRRFDFLRRDLGIDLF